MKTRDVRVLTWPCRRKVPIFHAESGGVEFKAYKRTGWWENPNAFAGIAGARAKNIKKSDVPALACNEISFFGADFLKKYG